MSVLTAETSIRTTATTRRQHTFIVQPVRVLSWSTTRDGIWDALIGSTTAGTIHRTDAGFQVRDWQGTIESLRPTLEAAQLSLEPAVRTAARAATEAIRRRAGLLTTSTTVVALMGFAGIITTWIATNPF